jgi:two-component system, cell cycle sensor histidine kinase and response regulator CckA
MQSTQPETRIYIVDDESALASMAEQILGLGGYRATVFDDPAKALEEIKKSAKGSVLLITDCIMGKMNGLELIEEAQKHVKDLRTILLSGTITGEFVRKCQVQPDRFLAKPYAADKLLMLVDELAGASATRAR